MNTAFIITSIIVISVSFILSIIFFKYGKISMAFVSLIICLVWTGLMVTDLHKTDTYRIADYNQSELGVIRIYDLDGNIIDEYNGNLIVDRQDGTINFVEIDGDKIITFDEDGEIKVKERE